MKVLSDQLRVIMERQQLPPSQQVAYCYCCGHKSLQRKNLKKHFDRAHPFELYKETTQIDAEEKQKELKNNEEKSRSEKVKSRKQCVKKERLIKRKEEELAKIQLKKVKDAARKELIDKLKQSAENRKNKTVPQSLCFVRPLGTFGNNIRESGTGSTNVPLSYNSEVQIEELARHKAVLPDRLKFDQEMQAARSVDTLLESAKSFKKDLNNNAIVCIPCNNYFGKGTISYNFAAGETFDDEYLHENFSELKRKVKEHIYNTSSHKRCATGTSQADKLVTTEEDKKAGIVIGRLAYKCHKQSAGLNKFEEELQVAEANEAVVGDINHSAALARNLTPHFYAQSKKHVVKELGKILAATGEPAHFSVIADKASPNSDTLHIVGIIIPYKDKLEPVFLGFVEHVDGSGPGLAVEIHSMLQEFFTETEIKSRLVGGSWDGQYVHNSVETSLRELLEVSQEDKFMAFNWDAAHGVELAGKAAILDVEFVRDTFCTVNTIANKYKVGKSLRELKDIRETNLENILSNEESSIDMRKQKLKRFKNFSTTRFITYSKDAITAVRENFKEVYEHLNNEKNPLLNDVQNASFVLRLNGLQDIYNEMGHLSKQLQRPDVFTWDIEEQVDASIVRLGAMKAEFDSPNEENSNNIETNYAATVKELMDTGTYMGMPIINNRQGPMSTWTRARSKSPSRENSSLAAKVITTSKELATHTQKLQHNLQKRLNSKLPDVQVYSRNVFSMNEIKKRPKDTVPICLKKLTKLSQDAGLIENGCSMEQIADEYIEFAEIVQKEQDAHHHNKDLKASTNIYIRLLNSENNFPNVSKMLSAACARSYCESVTEGFGSKVAAVVNGRESLGIERLNQEVFIALNGPTPGKASTGLVVNALDEYFGKKPWRFNRTSDKRKLQRYEVSKSVDKLNAEKGKFGVIEIGQ